MGTASALLIEGLLRFPGTERGCMAHVTRSSVQTQSPSITSFIRSQLRGSEIATVDEMDQHLNPSS